MDIRDDRSQLFGLLGHPETVTTFFDRVADDVRWTVHGTSPISGCFTSKSEFVDATFQRLAAVMRDQVRLQLLRLHVDGDVAIAELRADSTTLEGTHYDNRVCWICRFDGQRGGDLIVEVAAYLDSALVTWTLSRNER